MAGKEIMVDADTDYYGEQVTLSPDEIRQSLFSGVGKSPPIEPCAMPCMTDEDYRADSALSHTQLERYRRNPEDFLEIDLIACREPPRPTPSMLVGQRLHSEVLLPPWYRGMTTIPADVLSSNGQRRGKKWEAWRDANDDKDIVTAAEKEQIDAMVRSLNKCKSFAMILRSDDLLTEYAIKWPSETHGSEGLLLKCRFDIICPDQMLVCDIKTTSVSSYRNLQRAAYAIDDYGYARQAAHYSEGASALFGNHQWQWLIAFVMNSAPYSVQMIRIDPDWVMHEHLRVIDTKKHLCRSIETGNWKVPSQDDIIELMMPRNPLYSDLYEVKYD